MLGLFFANEIGALFCALAKLSYFVAILACVFATWQIGVGIAMLGMILLHVPGSYLRFKADKSAVLTIKRRSW